MPPALLRCCLTFVVGVVMSGCAPASAPPLASLPEEIASVSAQWHIGCAPWDGAALEIEWSDVYNVKHKLSLYDHLNPPFSGVKSYDLGASRPQSGRFMTQTVGVYDIVPHARATVSSEKGAGVISGFVVAGHRKWTFDATPSGQSDLPCG